VEGYVKDWNQERGYGFIEHEKGADIFVHHNDILGDGYKSLEVGAPVEFDLIDTPKGKKALNVRPFRLWQ
jgi:CspA family cold shock protein